MFDYDLPSRLAYYSDIFNFLIILLVLIYSKEKKIISNELTLYLFVSSIFCFVLNYIIFDWSFFPDQNKYRILSSSIRQDLFLDFKITKAPSISQYFSGLIFSIIPIPFIETINSLSFSNKLLFVISIIFFVRQKIITKNYYLFFIFFPSVLLYSSLSLKDNLVMIFLFFIIYFIVYKKYFNAFLLVIVLSFFKMATGLFTLIFLFLHIYFFSKGEKYFYHKLFSILLLGIILVNLFIDPILNRINFHTSTFYEQGNFEGNFIKINNSFELFYRFVISVISAFLLPVNLEGSILRALLMFENILFLIVLVLFVNKYYSKIKTKFNFWILYLVFNYGIFNLIVSNPGTFGRYKYPISIALIFAILCEVKKKKLDEKKNNILS